MAITQLETLKGLIANRQSLYSEISPVRATLYYCADCAITEGCKIGESKYPDNVKFGVGIAGDTPEVREVVCHAAYRCPHVMQLVAKIIECFL